MAGRGTFARPSGPRGIHVSHLHTGEHSYRCVLNEVHIEAALAIHEPPLLAVLHGHPYSQRVRPLGLWCHTNTPRPSEDPSGIVGNDWTTPEAKWQEQVARHLVPTSGHNTYPPSASGQYDLRLTVGPN